MIFDDPTAEPINEKWLKKEEWVPDNWNLYMSTSNKESIAWCKILDKDSMIYAYYFPKDFHEEIPSIKFGDQLVKNTLYICQQKPFYTEEYFMIHNVSTVADIITAVGSSMIKILKKEP